MPAQKRDRRPGLRVVARKGSQALYLRGTIGGKSVFESLKTGNRALAEEARVRRENELLSRAIHGTAPEVTFAAAAASYLEVEERSQSTRFRVAGLLKYFEAHTTCAAIDQATIDGAARALCRASSKSATRFREVVSPAIAVLNHAARRGWCPPPSFEKPKAAGKRTDWLTPAEAEAMLTAAASHLKPLLIFLFCTGARLDEAIGLEWRRVDLRHARATLMDTKNGDDRIVDLPPRLVVALANVAGDRDGRVFRYRDVRGQWQDYRRTDDSATVSYGGQIKRAWATALRQAKIDRHLTPHHARHTWASWQYCRHKDLLRLRDEGGWRTVAMCERYAKLVPDGLRPEIEAFFGLRANKVHSGHRKRKIGDSDSGFRGRARLW